MKIFLDTQILIALLAEDKAAVAKIEELKLGAVFYTSSINMYEIWRGIGGAEGRREQAINAVQRLTANINVLPIDHEVAQRAALLYQGMRAKGKPVNELDYLIAGAGLANGVDVFVTNNAKHFENMDGIKKIIAY